MAHLPKSFAVSAVPFFLLFSVVDSLHFSGGCLLVLDLEPKGEASTATHTKSGMKNEVAVEAEKERDRKRAREREYMRA